MLRRNRKMFVVHRRAPQSPENSRKMGFPSVHGIPHFREIPVQVVRALHIRSGRDVIHEPLRDVRRDAQLAEIGAEGAPDVV